MRTLPDDDADPQASNRLSFLGVLALLAFFAAMVAVDWTMGYRRIGNKSYQPSDIAFYASLLGPLFGSIAAVVFAALRMTWWKPILYTSLWGILGAVLLPIADPKAGLSESLCVLHNWLVVGWVAAIGCSVYGGRFPMPASEDLPEA